MSHESVDVYDTYSIIKNIDDKIMIDVLTKIINVKP